MNERKELKPIYARFAQEWIEGEDGDLYIREEADAVMDAMEARIKELEEEVQHRKAAQESLNFELSVRSAKIKELEAKIAKLDDAFESCKTNLESEKATNEELRERIKELGTELGTQLGTDQVAEAGKMVWISVKDRLPNVHEKVFVYGWYSPRKNERACFTETCSFSRWDSVYGKWSFSCDGVVTHWMPLPSVEVLK